MIENLLEYSMNIPQNLRKRINYQGEFEDMLTDVAKSYGIGSFVSFEPMPLGIEDLNLKLITTKGKYFVKIFNEKRDDPECLRLVNIVKISTDNGVAHPEFLKRDVGYIFRNQYEQFNIRLAVFEFIEGKTFYELKRNPSTSELTEIIRMAAKVNEIDYKTADLYDRWATVNFPAEYKKAKKYLTDPEKKMFDDLEKQFEKINLKSLSHSLVHGDLIGTNIIKGKEKIYFVDFSSANFYPRIVELAVLMSDIMFDPTGKVSVEKYFDLLVTQYQKYIKLTKEDLEALPLFVKLAHAMNFIGSTLEKEKLKNKSEENEYWLKLSKKGLDATLKVWK